MSKRIFICENSNSHHETCVISSLMIFKELNFDVNLVLGKLAHDRLKNHLQKERVHVYRTFSMWDMLKCIFSIRRTDYILFNTISLRVSPFIIFFSLLSSKNILYVRNANSWVEYKPNSKKLSHRIAARTLFGIKRFLLKRAEALAVGQSNMAIFLKDHFAIPTIYIPFSPKKSSISENKNSRLKVVIPGTVDFLRKNNNVMHEALQKIEARFDGQYEVVFLGRAVNKYSEEFLQKMKAENSSVSFYSKFIDQAEFDRQLAEADLILGIINIHHAFDYYTETYGLTKDTGVEAHAIAYSKPLVVNVDYAMDARIKSSSVTFSSADELKKIIEKALTSPDWLLNLKNEAKDNASQFELKTVSQNIQETLGL